MSCGGLIFNRHRWKYLDKIHRTCEVCGTCQTYYAGEMECWWNETFDSMMRDMDSQKRYRDTNKQSQEKALNFIHGLPTSAKTEVN